MFRKFIIHSTNIVKRPADVSAPVGTHKHNIIGRTLYYMTITLVKAVACDMLTSY